MAFKKININKLEKLKLFCNNFLDEEDLKNDLKNNFQLLHTWYLNIEDEDDFNYFWDLCNDFPKYHLEQIPLFNVLFQIKADWDEINYYLKNYDGSKYVIEDKNPYEHPGQFKDYLGDWDEYQDDYDNWRNGKESLHPKIQGWALLDEFYSKHGIDLFNLIDILNFRKKILSQKKMKK